MNKPLTFTFSVLTAVVLFLHGLAAFSEDIVRRGGERLRVALRRMTQTDCRKGTTLWPPSSPCLAAFGSGNATWLY